MLIGYIKLKLSSLHPNAVQAYLNNTFVGKHLSTSIPLLTVDENYRGIIKSVELININKTYTSSINDHMFKTRLQHLRIVTLKNGNEDAIQISLTAGLDSTDIGLFDNEDDARLYAEVI